MCQVVPHHRLLSISWSVISTKFNIIPYTLTIHSRQYCASFLLMLMWLIMVSKYICCISAQPLTDKSINRKWVQSIKSRSCIHMIPDLLFTQREVGCRALRWKQLVSLCSYIQLSSDCLRVEKVSGNQGQSGNYFNNFYRCASQRVALPP